MQEREKPLRRGRPYLYTVRVVSARTINQNDEEEDKQMTIASYNKDNNEFWSTIDENKKPRISKDIDNITYELNLIESQLSFISSMLYEMPDSFKMNDETISDMISGIINYLRRLLSDLDDATANTIIVKMRDITLKRFYELCELKKVDAKEYANTIFDADVNARYRTFILNK